MNVDLRPSTRRMIEESAAAAEARAFIEWLHAEHYTDYVIDCHIRRLLFLLPRLWPGTSPPVLRDAQLSAEFGRERQPRRGSSTLPVPDGSTLGTCVRKGAWSASHRRHMRISFGGMTSTL
jgi:hypothetical protein